MDQPVEARREWRWVLFIRLLRKAKKVEVTDVRVIPAQDLWLGDPVDESLETTTGEQIDVVQDSIDIVPLRGLSVPHLGLHYEDQIWTVRD
ncbi:hypothetical protein OHA70_07490 [Kribbella sp. NBC_00382]|uniref:hypothetical protein n=1 Tax=Kribbella sp. NBC_00382 TaxID=2975967 RepID=UPI002E1DF738